MLDRYGIHLGALYIHFYALILLAGILAAAWLASREAARRGAAFPLSTSGTCLLSFLSWGSLGQGSIMS